jgi:putative copper export protein
VLTVYVVLVILIAVTVPRVTSTFGCGGSLVLATLAAAALGFGGHAVTAASVDAVTNDGRAVDVTVSQVGSAATLLAVAHQAAVTWWVAGVSLLLLAAWSWRRRPDPALLDRPGPLGRITTGRLTVAFDRFSAIALFVSALVGLSGVILAVLYLESWSSLMTGRGALVVAKGVLTVLILGCAAVHLGRSRPALRAGDVDTFYRIARIELVIMVVAVAVAGVLGHLGR